MPLAPPTVACARPGAVAPAAVSGRLERVGLWLRDHQRLVRRLQWAMVALYLPLLILPALLPPPVAGTPLWASLAGGVQLLFWGLWLPGVLVSVLLFGRLWCGLLCPEGALTAAASRHGKGWAIPRWMKWPGWPFAMFAGVTLWGQVVSVYDRPEAALLVFGTSGAAAVLVGWLYGREKRVWCRFLCPANGMFGLLAKLAPMHYRVHARAWDACSPERARTMRFTCEPMVPVRMMESASPCHMCGRCAGFRDAVRLEPRPPGEEIRRSPGSGAESLMAIAGLLGIGSAAFWWPAAPGLGALAQVLGEAPARLLTMVLLAVAVAAAVALPLALAARGQAGLFHRLALATLPLGAAGLLAGFGRHSVGLVAAGLDLRLPWAALLLFGAAWAVALGRGIVTRRAGRAAFALALAGPLAGWAWLLWA